jgi:vancomycin resistance protein YoaR
MALNFSGGSHRIFSDNGETAKDGIYIKRDKSTPEKNKKKRGAVAGIIAGIIVAVLAAGILAVGFYVKGIDTVYPNISIGSVALSGMTANDAKQALIDSGYEDRAKNIAVTVNYPDGEKMTITGEESGAWPDAGTAAENAVAYGKQGSFFANELDFIKCLVAGHKLDQNSPAKINEEYVKGIINGYVQAFNDKIMQDAYNIHADKITLRKGSANALADAGAIYDLVVSGLGQSITQNAPVTADYTVGKAGGSDIDLQAIYDSLHKEPVSAVYDAKKKAVTQSVVGVSFDVAAAQKALDEAQTGATVTIPLILTQPEVSTETLTAKLFSDVLSEKKTHVSGTSNRINNVKLATAAVNGFILNPGETFSYNDTLGKRTVEKGYKEAGAYSSGKVVQEIGGGICQVSSTLYYNVLHADLQVVERSNHMFIVTYLPLGIDATINWGTIDFKFKNNTEYPIKIEAIMENGYLNIRLLGTKTTTERVEVKYVVISEKDFKTVYKEDPSIAQGKTKVEISGEKGYVVDTYKYVYDEAGTLLSKTFIARSSYRPEDKVVLVPVGSPLAAQATVSPSPSPSASASPSASPSDTQETPPATTNSGT